MKTKVKIRAAFPACAALVLLTAALAGCAGGPRTELVVIPDAGESPSLGAVGQPFQVKTIYRLPAAEANKVQPLGWSDPDTVVALSANLRPRDNLVYQMQSLSPPYAEAAALIDVDAGMYPGSLSPDGRYLSATSRVDDGISIRLLSLADGEERTVATLAAGEAALLSEAGAWSQNGRYLAYLLVGMAPLQDAGSRQAGPARVVPATRSLQVLVIDTQNGTAVQSPVNGLDQAARGLAAIPSNDADALLIVFGNAVRMAERDGSESGYAVKFSPPAKGDRIEGAAADWVNNDQFVYLDEDGTLYAHDRRNEETVVLLEKVGRFRLSRDRKAIAYFEIGQGAVYAGKLQGNNVLFGSPVYQGIAPAFLDWSPDGKRLLIDGRKLYAQTGRIPQTAPTAQPAEQLPLAEAADGQQLIVEFRSPQ